MPAALVIILIIIAAVVVAAAIGLGVYWKYYRKSASTSTPTMNWNSTSGAWEGVFSVVQPAGSTYPVYDVGTLAPVADYDSTTWQTTPPPLVGDAIFGVGNLAAIIAAGGGIAGALAAGAIALPSSFSTITLDTTGSIVSIL